MAAKIAEAKQATVADVGGAFIYSADPATLAAWYKDKLGIELIANEQDGGFYYVFPASKVVFAINPAKSPLSGEKNQFMVNFRLDDFEGFLQRLRAKGVVVERTEDYPYGRFGWIKDSEGNPVEFWQPKKT